MRYKRGILQLRIFLLQCLYRFCLSRKSLILSVRLCLIRLNLFSCKRKLITKHSRDWRLGVFDDEVIEFLQLIEYAHSVMSRSTTRMS